MSRGTNIARNTAIVMIANEWSDTVTLTDPFIPFTSDVSCLFVAPSERWDAINLLFTQDGNARMTFLESFLEEAGFIPRHPDTKLISMSGWQVSVTPSFGKSFKYFLADSAVDDTLGVIRTNLKVAL